MSRRQIRQMSAAADVTRQTAQTDEGATSRFGHRRWPLLGPFCRPDAELLLKAKAVRHSRRIGRRNPEIERGFGPSGFGRALGQSQKSRNGSGAENVMRPRLMIGYGESTRQNWLIGV